jgi:hypothetical protein
MTTFYKAVNKRLALVLFSATVMVGCTTPITPDFSAMSKKYANILEQYQIDMVFTNIIRSSLDHPLSFLDMPNITGTGTITSIPSLSTSFIGMGSQYVATNLTGALASITPSFSMQAGNSFNFSQSSLDNSAFWKPFLTPIQLETARYFIQNHIPREVMFSLVIDEIVITAPDGKQRKLINNPLRSDYPEFQKEMYQLLSYGLSIKSVFNRIDEGVPMTEAELKKNYGDNPKKTLGEHGMKLELVSSSPVPKYQIIKLSPTLKLCIEKNRFENYVKQNYGSGLFCQVAVASQAATKNITKEPQIDFSLRSTKNIYDFLGQVVDAQLADPPYLVTLPPTEETVVKKSKQGNNFALLLVNKNTDVASFSTMDALDGNTYSIPKDNGGYSTLVINLLAQFQVLTKAPGSIPSSPAVLIK